MGFIKRLCPLSSGHGFFLLGARGTGKTTLLRQRFGQSDTLWIDLLSSRDERRFSKNPDLLSQLLNEKPVQHVVIDEVQRVPKLLDVVHLEIERPNKTQFIVTGSSARKLKRGQANLLAGRLFYFHLYPLTHIELGRRFNLNHVLKFGSLPKVMHLKTQTDKAEYLEAFAQTHLKEEVLIEQVLRKVQPFKDFLSIASSCSGQIVNYSNIAKDVGVDTLTVQSYFNILSDTFLGFYLPSFARSVRQQQRKAPKFFIFDLGVRCALARQLDTSIKPKGFSYGNLFEHFIILELIRLNDYYRTRFQFSYLQDKNGAEVDVIVQKPTGKEVLVEIKSSLESRNEQAQALRRFVKCWDRPCEAQLWSQDPMNRKKDGVHFYHWQHALRKLFKK